MNAYNNKTCSLLYFHEIHAIFFQLFGKRTETIITNEEVEGGVCFITDKFPAAK